MSINWRAHIIFLCHCISSIFTVAIAIIFSIIYHMPNSLAASLLVTPTRIEISNERNASQSIKITNQGDSLITLQARAYEWKDSVIINNDQGISRDLVVIPPIFSLEPNASQVIRMALRSPITEPVERAYRLMISEVPDGRNFRNVGVRVLLRLSIPIFALADEAFPEVAWNVSSSDRSTIITFSNTGTSHINITKINIYNIINNNKILIQSVDQPFDIIAGGHKDFAISKNFQGRLWVDVESDVGPLWAELHSPN